MEEMAGGSWDSDKVYVPHPPKIDIIEGESRVVIGERETKPQCMRTSSMSRNMHLSNQHLDDPYLRTCGLCKRSLAPGHKIYMYRGNVAFCSSECREQQMKREKKSTSRPAKKAIVYHYQPPSALLTQMLFMYS